MEMKCKCCKKAFNSYHSLKYHESSCPMHQKQSYPVEIKLQYIEELNICGFLGQGRSGVVCKGYFRGIQVAWKLCDISKFPKIKAELLNEVAAYHAMQDIQGVFIPKLLAHRSISRLLYANGITYIAGHHPTKPSSEEKKLAMAALRVMHQCGILHNDIHKQNILISRDGIKKQCFLIDFGCSIQSRDKEARRKERQLLWHVLST